MMVAAVMVMEVLNKHLVLHDPGETTATTRTAFQTDRYATTVYTMHSPAQGSGSQRE
jgi:hypothetical protein